MKVLVIGNVGFDLMAPYLRAKGIETVLVVTTSEPLNAEYADKAFMFLSDCEYEPLVDLALSEKVDAVISIAGPDIVNVRDSHVKDVLEGKHGIPVLANPIDAVMTAANKIKTKEFLAKHGLPTTEGKRANSIPEALSIAKDFGYPIVVKIPDNSGGIGMRLAENRLDLIKSVGKQKGVLLEKYVSGPEFSVEVLNFEGKAIPLLPVFKGYTNHSCLHPMERVKLAPAPLSESNTALLRDMALKAITALNVQPTGDVDIVWSENGPLILEINPRFGGVTALSMAASGIVSYYAIVDMLLGDWHSTNYDFDTHYAADMPVYSDMEIDQVNTLLGINGVFRVKLQKLSKTSGRIALKARSKSKLFDTAKQVSSICNCPDCYIELKNIPGELKVAAH
jgi:carbamoylphosphate synthase large subunit